MFEGRQENIEIGILLYPCAQMATILGLTDLFKIAEMIIKENLELSSVNLRISHWQFKENTKIFHRVYDTKPGLTNHPNIMIIPSSLSEPLSLDMIKPYIPWLQKLYCDGTILASICAGIFLLAETNLILDRNITLHWKHKSLFEERFQNIKIDVDQLVIDHGDIMTSGGIMSWIDLGLTLVKRYCNNEVMVKTAQILLVDTPGRQQSYYHVFMPKLNHGDEVILKIQQWLEQTNARDIMLATLADYACMEQRTFLRRFKQATGMTSVEYCQRLRVNDACQKLQSTRSSFDHIAWQVGYKDAGSFRKIFKRIMWLTTSEYRQRFNHNYIS